jgi:predicted RecB family endonuclease
METFRLSSYYLIACDRVHQVMDDLYEALHDEDGKPLTDLESVIDIVSSSRKEIYEELDIIKSIVAEYEGIQGRGHK